MDTPLRNNDVILTLDIPVSSQVREQTLVPAPVKEKKVEETSAEATQSFEQISEPEKVVQEQPEEQTNVSSNVEGKPVVRRFNAPLEILLNDEPLVLPPKEDGQPYYLMDLLTHSGIDFDNLSRPIRLAVNGTESGFQQIIRTDDSVEIRCI